MVLANAVQHVGQSVKIWLAAADLEHEASAKKRVLRKGKEIYTYIEIYEYQLLLLLSRSRTYSQLSSTMEGNRQP